MAATEDILTFFEILEKNGGWFFDFLSYFIAIVLVLIAVIYFRRMWKGEVDWIGRQEEDPQQDQQQTEIIQKMIDEWEERINQITLENELLNEELKEKNEQIGDMIKSIKELNQLYEELDEKYEDETYTTSQILYTADEIAAALVNEQSLLENRYDIFMNIFDYLINTMKDFREKNSRIVIHVPHPEKEGYLTHFAHSSSHSHRVKEYDPPIQGSAAGYAWRTNQDYYIANVEEDYYEYDQKIQSNKYYHTLYCVPLTAGNEISTRIGVMSITGKSVDAYEEMEKDRIVLFSKLLYPLVYVDLKKRGVLNRG